MHWGKVYSAQTDLSRSDIVEVEVDVTKSSLPGFTIVGLGDKAIEESRERVNAAIKNSGLTTRPPKSCRTVASLAPANTKKEGPHFDLAVAIAFLLADQEIEFAFNPEGKIFIGELALDGKVKSVDGVLPLVNFAKEKGFTDIFIPEANIQEASLIENINLYPVKNLKQLKQHLEQEIASDIIPELLITPTKEKENLEVQQTEPEVDLCDVIGQKAIKRALEIAAAGGHNIAMYGPPGTGKTMMAKAFIGILPSLNTEQTIKATSIHSYAGTLGNSSVQNTPPLRAPHHTSSYAAIIGGGTYPRPGEATLAHHGVLFLDEFPEFDKRVLESLREPMEEGVVRIARSKGSVVFPSEFILIAALNPPSEVSREKHVSVADKRRFQRKLSGPIIDRIDIWVEVPKINHERLLQDNSQNTEEYSVTVAARVQKARDIQTKRFEESTTNFNSRMSAREVKHYSNLEESTKKLLNAASAKMDLSPRAYHKILKLAQTIADLENTSIKDSHILEALQYRPREII